MDPYLLRRLYRRFERLGDKHARVKKLTDWEAFRCARIHSSKSFTVKQKPFIKTPIEIIIMSSGMITSIIIVTLIILKKRKRI